jgi:GTPase SAR1 family protein
MKSIIFLGPDRVGKTTLINNTKQYLERKQKPYSCLHFKEIKPKHHSPMDQFRDALTNINPDINYLLIDRFVSDTLFYEPRRGQMPPIDPSCTLEIESLLFDISSSCNFIVIEADWGDVYDRHVKELVDNYPGSSHYWRESQLSIRKKEHEDYYIHTDKYFFDQNLFCSIRLCEPTKDEPVFSYFPWLE